MEATDASNRITVHVEENIFDLGSVGHPERPEEYNDEYNVYYWSSLNQCTSRIVSSTCPPVHLRRLFDDADI